MISREPWETSRRCAGPLTGTNFNNAYLGKANLSDSQIKKGDRFGCKTDLQARSFYKANFTDAFLEEVVVNDTQFYGSKWIGATLNTVQFSDSDFRTANFSFDILLVKII